MKYVKLTIIATVTLFSCTKLEEKLGSQVATGGGSGGAVSPANILAGTYDAMRTPYQDQSRVWASQEHTTDECIGPTRAGDWDDNGVWRVLHSHQWDPNHGFLADTYRDLGRIIFSATDLLRFSPSAQQAAEGKFLRAMAMFSLLDGWDQVPYRDNTADPEEVPKVRKGTAAMDYIISEITAALPGLPDAPARICNKDAARVLLMKCYLNKGVYGNRAAPTFAAADMNQVITLADQVMNSARGYSLAANFFDNFAPGNDNATLAREVIWSAENIGGVSSGNVRSRWFCGLHYNQNPSGWNGFTTLSDFYDKFEAADKRRGGAAYPGMTQGVLPGFLIGQQFNGAGQPLNDRTGAPLAFTRAVKSIEVGSNLEVTGIRVIKYPIDYTSGDNSNNDYVYFRISDVILMKAEAILRGGTATASPAAFGGGNTALAQVNFLRTHVSRGASALTSLTLDNLLDERGRELYWEGWRRNDLIRFGKFLNAWQEKPASDARSLLFPIPARSLAANPNLTQNPGY
ncbi:MAG: RagB/SusD family nutrient uptake outer membrane protein [Chitinophagaceae bacterium]|nr:RagB/SusD family nutrient uptake outer membrane protein [Chitinophagaceae bacterium]